MSTVSYANVVAKGSQSPEPVNHPVVNDQHESASETSAITEASNTSSVESNTTAEESTQETTAESSTSPSPSPKAAAKPAKVNLAPAPVPEVSAWGSATSSRSNSNVSSANVDSKHWPSPLEVPAVQSVQQQQSGSKKINTVKTSNEKWVPFKATVVLPQPGKKSSNGQKRSTNKNGSTFSNSNKSVSTDKKKKNKFEKRPQDQHQTQQHQQKPQQKPSSTSSSSTNTNTTTTPTVSQSSEESKEEKPEESKSNGEVSHPESSSLQQEEQPQSSASHNYQPHHQQQQQHHHQHHSTNNHHHSNNNKYSHNNFHNNNFQQQQSHYYQQAQYLGPRPFRPYNPNRRYNKFNNNYNRHHSNGGHYVPYHQRRQNVNFNAEPLYSLVKQIEYYFSIENLLKDIFLRKQMNQEGWLDLNVIANFYRMQVLSTGDFQLVKKAIEELNGTLLELAEFENGIFKVRVKENWNTWVLPTEQREGLGKDDSKYLDLVAPKAQEPEHEEGEHQQEQEQEENVVSQQGANGVETAVEQAIEA